MCIFLTSVLVSLRCCDHMLTNKKERFTSTQGFKRFPTIVLGHGEMDHQCWWDLVVEEVLYFLMDRKQRVRRRLWTKVNLQDPPGYTSFSWNLPKASPRGTVHVQTITSFSYFWGFEISVHIFSFYWPDLELLICI